MRANAVPRFRGAGLANVIRFGMVGFVAGLCVALALSQISLQRTIPEQELKVLWPTALLGLDFGAWADGSTADFLALLLVFVGNGVVYAVGACCFAGFIELVMDVSERITGRSQRGTGADTLRERQRGSGPARKGNSAANLCDASPLRRR